MGIIYIIVGIVLAFFLLEYIKHHFMKSTSKLVVFGVIILVLFLVFSYNFKDSEDFEKNNIVQTGAAVAEGLVDIFDENVNTEALINSTVKSNKLFKS